MSVTTTTASSWRAPRATAEVTATRSAQIVAPNVRFSTLQPAWMEPSDISTAEPTRKALKGA